MSARDAQGSRLAARTAGRRRAARGTGAGAARSVCAQAGEERPAGRARRLECRDPRGAARPSGCVPEIERRAAAPRTHPPAHRRVGPSAFSLAATCAAGWPCSCWSVTSRVAGRCNPAVELGRRASASRASSLAAHPPQDQGRLRAAARQTHVVRKGDTLQLGYVAAGKRFGVIASIDARGTVTLHLPETPGPGGRAGARRRARPAPRLRVRRFARLRTVRLRHLRHPVRAPPMWPTP